MSSRLSAGCHNEVERVRASQNDYSSQLRLIPSRYFKYLCGLREVIYSGFTNSYSCRRTYLGTQTRQELANELTRRSGKRSKDTMKRPF